MKINQYYTRYLFLLLCVNFIGCVKYSPYEVIVDPHDRDINAKNVSRILSMDQSNDTITFIFIGDTQRYYEESIDFVESINLRNDIDFVAISGDLTDFGLLDEFHGIAKIFGGLKVPYITAVGNHDLIYNGRLVYEEMYGPLDYVFTFKRMKFIVLNTNSREFGFNGSVPNIPWLNFHLSDTSNYTNAIVIEHVPPNNADFDPNLEMPYATTLAKWEKTLLSMNGHNHDQSVGRPYSDGVTYFNSYSVGKGMYSVIRVWPGGFEFENISL